MSKLNELMQSLCPDGVQYKKIKDIAEVGTGSSNGNEAQDDGDYPFFIRSQTVKHKNEWEYDEEAIIIPGEGGIGEIYHYINGKYAIHQRVYRIHFLDSEVSVKFAFHYFRSCFKEFIMRKAVSATVKSIRKPMIEDFIIPVPPLEVQSEIVRILDNFTELTAELTAELTDRKKQYNYYLDKLLSFEESDANWKSLGDMGEFTYGYAAKAKDSGDARFIRITDINTNGKLIPTDAKFVDIIEENKRFVLKKNDLLMARTGATYGKTMIFEEDYSAIFAGFLIKLSFDKKIINPKYYWHFAQSELFWWQANKLVSGGGQPQFNANAVREVKIPVPYPEDPDKSLEEQNRIVSILDRFDTLVNDISSGLPAEIEARQKQYEYYRDKLLTFKELS